MTDYIETIKNKYFANHIAVLKKQGNIEILYWKNPNDIYYYIRYVFDENRLYITGDCGCACFVFTHLIGLVSFSDMSFGYFAEKVEAMRKGKKSENEKRLLIYLTGLQMAHEQILYEQILYEQIRHREIENKND